MVKSDPIKTSTLASILSGASLPFALTSSEIASILAYIDLLVRWNSTYSLTTYNSLQEIALGLILPSLAFAEFIPHGSAIVDLGPGPGIPSVPLKLVRPDLKMTLIESASKPYEFLQTCTSDLDLVDFTTINARAEEIAHDGEHRGKYDVVVARSFAPLPIVIETGSAYVRTGGLIVVQVSSASTGKIRSYTEAMAQVGTALVDTWTVDLGTGGMDPVDFAIFVQEKPCRERYPRKWKAMKNRPLWEISVEGD